MPLAAAPSNARFDGIHWDTLGHIAGDGVAETRGIQDFVETASVLLGRRGLRQTVNFVGMNWWDRDLVRRCCEFPYVEIWSTQTEKQYYVEMSSSRGMTKPEDTISSILWSATGRGA